MTSLLEAVDHAAGVCRQLKDDKVADGKEITAIPSTVLVFRGDNLVALISPDTNEARRLLAAAEMAAYGMSADLLCIALETYNSTRRENPVTGERWAPGEMQEAALEHDGIAKGWVRESLVIVAYNRSGDAVHRMIPYTISNGEVEWAEPMDSGLTEPNSVLGGYLHNTMLQIMDQPPLVVRDASVTAKFTAEFSERFGDAGGEIMQAWMDCAVAKLLMNEVRSGGTYAVGLLGEPGSPRAAAIEKSFADEVD